MAKKCYPVVKGLDDVLAKVNPEWTPEIIANLRSIYEERTGNVFHIEHQYWGERAKALKRLELVLKEEEKEKSGMTTGHTTYALRKLLREALLSISHGELKWGVSNTLKSVTEISDIPYIPLIDRLFTVLDKENKPWEVIIDKRMNAPMMINTIGDRYTLYVNTNGFASVANNISKVLGLFAHEMTHAVTSNAFNNYAEGVASKEEIKFVDDVKSFVGELKNKYDFGFGWDRSIDTPLEEAKYLKETVANIMSRVELQSELAKYKLDDNKSAWSKFVDIVSSWFKKFLNMDIDNTALSKILKVVDTHISNVETDPEINKYVGRLGEIFKSSSDFSPELDSFDTSLFLPLDLERAFNDEYTENWESKPLEGEALEHAAKTLEKLQKQLAKEEVERHNKFLTNPSVSYRALVDNFSAQEKYDRINMISTIFSDVLDSLEGEYPNYSRKQLVNGVRTEGGKTIGGQANILNIVKGILEEQYSEALESGDSITSEKLKKVFDNWGALVSFARIRLRDIEDLKIGQKTYFADDSDPNSFNDNDMTIKFVMEESKREGWMDNNDLMSSFGSVGKQVRKIISRVQAWDNGEPKFDDLGFPVMNDPVRVHQELLDVLRGMTGEDHMISLLNSYKGVSSWVEPFLEELNDPVIRTQFYVDFKKNFQPYGMQTETIKKDETREYKTPVLNNQKDATTIPVYLSSIRGGEIINPSLSIFSVDDMNTVVIPSKVESLKEDISKMLTKDGIFGRSPFFKLPKIGRHDFILRVTQALNIPTTPETIDRLLNNYRDLSSFLKELQATGEHALSLRKDELEGKKLNYETLVNRPSKTAPKGLLREKLSKMLNILNKYNKGLMLESRTRYNDTTYFSHVNGSFLGDRMDFIEACVKAKNTSALRQWLSDTYLKSSQFFYGGSILNDWIAELYNSDLNDEDSFAAQFSYKRFLGSSKLPFEDFTSSTHIVQMMNEYFSERQLNPDSRYAYYPVFVLGDSGVSKYIKAKRYSKEEILEGMYKVFIQEHRRSELAKATNGELTKKGYKEIANLSKYNGKFTMLRFLNEQKYSSMIDRNNLKETVKAAIEEYFKDAISNFTTNLTTNGLLQQTQDGKYVYFNQEVESSRMPIEDIISDYFMNTKYANIQQLQMFTIDTSFYKDTKDLQKRYKEIHAPGVALSVEATDPWNNNRRFSEDGYETAVYFQDIEVNAEQTNPDFMQVIESLYGKESSIYKKYQKNTLTDGQGYRSLESYRKVMGMAGKWDANMQAAYEQIQNIRAKIGESNTEVPDVGDIKALNRLAVIFQPIKPYMYTFEEFPVNGDTQLIPVQHKYAEIILIPELLPPGSKLRDMGIWMEENHVDLLASITVVKVGGFGQTNIDGITDSGSLRDTLSKGYVHRLRYSDYRVQTNVPEHINSSQLFPTQGRKLIMAKTNKDKDYSSYVGGSLVNLGHHGNVKLTGKNLIKFYNALNVANILDSYHTFEEAVKDEEALSERLIQGTTNNSRNPLDNVLSYEVVDGKTRVPLSEGGLEHDSASLYFSLFKKIVNKQAIKGGSAVQASAMGITGYDESDNLKFVTDEDKKNILYAECEMPFDLSYTDVTGNIIPLEFTDWCEEDGTLKKDNNGDPLIEKVYPGILDIVAFRIPTERAYSMLNLKVVRFSHKTAGGTIKVPAQGTTISGFDFDIDKLYFLRRQYQFKSFTKEGVSKIWADFYKTHPNIKEALVEAKFNKVQESIDNAKEVSLLQLYKFWDDAGLPYSYKDVFNRFILDNQDKYSMLDKYDYTKSPIDNSRVARDNELINLIWNRLSDYETIRERTTPGGFSNASKAALTMRVLTFGDVSKYINDGQVNMKALEADLNTIPDPEPNYDPTDPMTLVTYNQQNQVAGKLIGIFANQNTNTAISSLFNKMVLKTPISFAGKSLFDLIHNDEIDTSLTVAEFLSASVDAVKDPVLNFLNLNTITADAGAMLARLGYTTTEIGLLFNQPIIKDICDYCFNNDSGDITSAIINVMSNKYGITREVAGSGLDTNNLTSEKLAYNIVSNIEEEVSADKYFDFAVNQSNVAMLFSRIIDASSELSNFVRKTKFTASNAVGSNFGQAYKQIMGVDKYLTSESSVLDIKVSEYWNQALDKNSSLLTLDDSEYLKRILDNPIAYEQAMYDMNRRLLKKSTQFFPYQTSTYIRARTEMARLTRSGLLSEETIDSIHRDLMVAALSSKEDSEFNGNYVIEFNGEPISARDYYLDVFPNELYRRLASNPGLKERPLFQYLRTIVDEDSGRLSIELQDVGGLDPSRRDELIEDWASIQREDPKLAKSLFMYNFHKLGFDFSYASFMSLAPTEVKLALTVGKDYNGNDISYTDFIRQINSGEYKSVDVDSFIYKYIRNHLDNTEFVYVPKGRVLNSLRGLVYSNNVISSQFTVSKYNKSVKGLIINQKEGTFMPAVVVDGVPFICNSGGFQLNKTDSDTITYYRVTPLGQSGLSMNYSPIRENNQTVPLENEGNTSVTPIPSSPSTIENELDVLIKEAVSMLKEMGTADTSTMVSLYKSLSVDMMQQVINNLRNTYNQYRDSQGNKTC